MKLFSIVMMVFFFSLMGAQGEPDDSLRQKFEDQRKVRIPTVIRETKEARPVESPIRNATSAVHITPRDPNYRRVHWSFALDRAPTGKVRRHAFADSP